MGSAPGLSEPVKTRQDAGDQGSDPRGDILPVLSAILQKSDFGIMIIDFQCI